MAKLTIDELSVFCKKKGFVYPNSEIYGSFAGFFDYGPLGVELKNNIKNELWKRFVQKREDVVGIDGAVITHPNVWRASGHIDSFADYIYSCEKCKVMVKGEDKGDEEEGDDDKEDKEGGDGDRGGDCKGDKQGKGSKGTFLKCPKCGGRMKSKGRFNLMFETNVGPSGGNTSYLRPETAQLIFIDYKSVQDTLHNKLPFGIAQLGKAFRNEISPRDFLFRSREFEQFELEFFVHPDRVNDCPFIREVKDISVNVVSAENQKKGKEHISMAINQLIGKKLCSPWHAYWLAQYYAFFLEMGIKGENLRLREHLKEELAHYASACFDIEYQFSFGWREIHGNADRGQFDLKQHMKFSNTSMEYFDEESRTKVIPYVAAEPSQGIDRAFLAFLADAYEYDQQRGNIVLKLNPRLAPVKVGVFPLVNKLNEKAKEVFVALKKEFNCIYDKSGSIGRRYARADEIGIPFCVTVDFESLKDNSATIRMRDTTEQTRVKISSLSGTLHKLVKGS